MRPNTIAARQPAPVHNWRRQRSQPPTTLWDILCIICCGPCYLLVECYDILDRFIARNRRRKHQHAAWPKPITSSSGTQIQPLTISEKNSAPQSKIFHLPLELRLLIYNYVFGLTDIHLVTFRYPGYSFHDRPYEYHLDSYPCFDPSAAARNHMCVCLTGWRQRTNGGRMIVTRFPDPGLGNDVTSLMLTCREFYHDILNITLNHRTFQVDNLDTLILASMVISHQLRSIRSLYLNTKVIAANTSFTGTTSHFPSSYRERFSHLPPRTPSIPKEKGKSYQGIWDAACDVISNMTSLKRLKIQLSFEAFEDVLHARDPEVIGSRESFVFEPLRRIAKKRDLNVFEVEVDWQEGTGKTTQKGKQKESFVLKRREAWTIPGVIIGR